MTERIPLLPLRDIVVFPHMVVPLYVGRAKSIRAVDAAMKGDRKLLLSAQRRAKTNEPSPEDIFEIGTVGYIMQHIPRPDGTVKILVEGRYRTRIESFEDDDGLLFCQANKVEELPGEHAEIEALERAVRDVFDKYGRLSKKIQPEVMNSIKGLSDTARLSDTVVAHLPLKHADKQDILEMAVVSERLEKLYELMQTEIEIMQVERKIRTRVKRQMEKTEKEYYLNEQMRAIQKELGERDEFKNELSELEEKLAEKNMPDETRERVEKELKKLKMMSPMSAEATVVRNYVDWCLALPWNEQRETHIDLKEAEEILDADHYGLEKPKERILEYLAVQKLVEKIKGPILCLVGPPGVGKTSLAKSIARATGRDFVRLALGGVRDEAEIRGHRRTYIGALPGKLVQSLKKAGSSNPVFLLDEIDKMSSDFRGDPASAMLEVLDPEQNSTFSDHYLDLEYDLSNVLFVCTANTLQGIPGPLEDRLEVIRIAGYTDIEKMQIAKRYLIPKQRRENGIKDTDVEWKPDGTQMIIDSYTREAGVRNLEREVGGVCRKIAKQVVRAEDGEDLGTFVVDAGKVQEYLGIPKFRRNEREDEPEVGMVTGLAWTSHGGDILRIEVTPMPGKGKLLITGKLGDVMQESAQAAMSYVRSRAESWGLDPKFYQELDLHIHVPEGAIPKDGPSAGITMATAIVSALTKIPVRRDVAMTGEVTLRGKVLPIGGLKEKSLAAMRAGIVRIVIPADNEKDIQEIPKEVLEHLEIVPVESMEQVLDLALELDAVRGDTAQGSVSA